MFKSCICKGIRAFTLIELLIVVAIIAILAAIAVPNFLEAQVRAKVSRAKSDMRSLSTALESYAVDNNHYPPYTKPLNDPGNDDMFGPSVFKSGIDGVSSRMIRLTTPVAYITSLFHEPFNVQGSATGGAFGVPAEMFDSFDYVDAESGFEKWGSGRADTSGGAWRLSCVGPDLFQSFGGSGVAHGPTSEVNQKGVNYDPTNGTVSVGDIVRVGGVSGEGGEPFYNRISGPWANN